MNKQQIMTIIRDEPYRIGHWLGFKDLRDIHNEWLKSFLFGEKDQTLLSHRGSYKTTSLSIAIALLMLIKPFDNIIFTRKTDDDVVEIVKQVSNALKSGAFQKMVEVLYDGRLAITKENSTEINTNLNSGTKGVSQLVGLGIKTSITGKHADIIITDDIVNITDRISRAERERIKLAYMELQNVKNRGGRFINTGTPWHKEDAISLMPNVKRFDCYSTGLMTMEEIKEIRKTMTDSLFAANYELKHIADADAIFKDPNFESNMELIFGGRGHIDAAYGGGDYTAYTEFNELEDGRIIGYGKIWPKHVDDCLNEICATHEMHRIGIIANETNGDKGYLAKELQARELPVYKYAERANKFIKISSYLRKNWERIYWLDMTDPEYLNQIIDYTEKAEHDDAPDSAASLLRYMEEPQKVQIRTFKGGI